MKLLIGTFLTFTLFLFGCQKEATEVDHKMGILTFNLSLDSMPISETRAASTDTDLSAYGFYLAGYHTQGGMEASIADAYPNVFDHDVLDKQVPVPLVKWTNKKFILKTIKWTLDETTFLSFFGWSQSKAIPTSGVSSATTGIIAQTISATDKGYPWLDIRNANAPADQTDVVGSQSLNHHNDAVISAVDLDFRHLLSKLTIKAKSTSKANITFTAVNIKYADSKVYKKARYTFNSNATMLGSYDSFAEYHSGTVALNTSYPSMTNGAEVALGSGLLLPQTLVDGDISLEIRYKLSPNSGALPGAEQTKTLPLSAFNFAQNKNYVYTIDVNATEIFVMSNPTIEPWVVSGTSMPSISGPKGDVLLLLDGYDKPYQHTDGKLYWLDRSGYNRHVALGNDVNYDGAKHSYVFKKGVVGGTIPNLGTISSLTVDLISECTGASTDHRPYSINSFFLQAPLSDTHVDWNYPGSYVRWIAPSRSDITKLNLWSVTYGSSVARIYNNAALKIEKNNTSSSIELKANSLAPSYDGRISYLRVTNREHTSTEINATYTFCQKRFGLPVNPTAPTEDDYVVINKLAWTKGNLVATGNNTCKVGVPSDYGLYFQFGSLIGWASGADGSGAGKGSPALDKRLWPNEMGTSKPNFEYRFSYAENIGTLSNYFFDYSVAPWKDGDASSDIGTFIVPMAGDIGWGNLRDGRYAKFGIGDPCRYYLGNPWRVPTQNEMKELRDVVSNSTTPIDGVNGKWFGPNPGSFATSIFLPFAGSRSGIANGPMYFPGIEGRYGTCSVKSFSQNYYMFMTLTQTINPDQAGRMGAISIRCVKNI